MESMGTRALAAGAAVLVLGGVLMTKPAAADARPHATVAARAPTTVAAQDTAGKAIFTGKGNCYACHGTDAKGGPLAPDLTDAKWLNVDGTLPAIRKVITEGVPSPKEHAAPMPAKGGAALTDAEVNAVANYVFALSQKK